MKSFWNADMHLWIIRGTKRMSIACEHSALEMSKSRKHRFDSEKQRCTSVVMEPQHSKIPDTRNRIAKLTDVIVRSSYLLHIDCQPNELLQTVALDIDLKLCVMTAPGSYPVTVACNNCRRRRLKCDRSLPPCLKCIKNSQECLCYQRLFLWKQGVSSRGKMAGMTFEDIIKDRARHGNSSLQVACAASLPSQHSSSCGFQSSRWCLSLTTVFLPG